MRSEVSAGRETWAVRALLRAARVSRTVVFLAGLLGPALLAGCYQPDSGDSDEDVARSAAPAAPTPAEPSGEAAPELPGEIPPAAGEPAGDPTGGTAAAGGAAAEGTDDLTERRGVTAFVGAASRGQYLTEQVAMCVQCHSPKDELGAVIADRKFQGSPIPVRSPYPREWAVEAPALAGLDFYTRDELVRLLTAGVTRDGLPPQPPMPPFRMTPEDASAIYDYLSGLTPE